MKKMRQLFVWAAVAALTIWIVPFARAQLPVKQLPTGDYYIENEIKFALKEDFAKGLAVAAGAGRPKPQARLRNLEPAIQHVRGGHTAADNWLEGKPLPARVRPRREGDVPMIARSLTAVLKPGFDAAIVVENLREHPDVEWASLSLIYESAAVPNDARYDEQWSLPLIGAEDAWDVPPKTTSIRIAIVDTGVALDHPDLAAIIVYDNGFAGNSDGDAPRDGRPAADHGTHVAGIAAAIRNNEVGIAGVATARIMAMGCAVWVGARNHYGIGDAVDAINDAIANDADVINCSFSQSDDMTPAMSSALSNARENGVIVVAAAGNDGRDVTGIEWDQSTVPIVVSSTWWDDTLVGTSNFGDLNYLIAAPGAFILSTIVDENGLDYGEMSGTSMAAPHVSGAVAMILSMKPYLSPAPSSRDLAIKDLLHRMAIDLDPPGIDSSFGHGRLNLPASFIQVLRDAFIFVGPPFSPIPPPGVLPGSYWNPASLSQGVDLAPPFTTLVLNGGASGKVPYTHPAITITKPLTLTVFPDQPVSIGK